MFFRKIIFDFFQPVSILQLKALQALIEERIAQSKANVENLEAARNGKLSQIGNLIHDSVPVSNDEENNKIERTFGDCAIRMKYSHVSLIKYLATF